jgi:hypothetical protein
MKRKPTIVDARRARYPVHHVVLAFPFRFSCFAMVLLPIRLFLFAVRSCIFFALISPDVVETLFLRMPLLHGMLNLGGLVRRNAIRLWVLLVIRGGGVLGVL